MKNLFCDKLTAACLCIKQSPPPLVKHIPKKNLHFVSGDRPTIETIDVESMMKELREIRDLLKNRVHSEEEQRYEAAKENEMKNDWMLAAAVLDRICAIVFAVIFLGGTVAFFVVFLFRP